MKTTKTLATKKTTDKTIKVVLCGGIMPRQGVELSAGFDLYVPIDTYIHHGRQVIKIGIKMSLPKGIDGHIRPRSGFSIFGMKGLSIPRFPWQKQEAKRFNADVIQGTIDCGYHDEIGIIINNQDKPFIIPACTRVAQMVFNRHFLPTLSQADTLEGFNRGGGFGHTGTK